MYRFVRKVLESKSLLVGNESYIYKEYDLTQEEFYLKRRLVVFIKELGYAGCVTPHDETSKLVS